MIFFKNNGDHVTVDYVQNRIYWLMVIWTKIRRMIEVTYKCMFWPIISIEDTFFFETIDFDDCHHTNGIFKTVWFLTDWTIFSSQRDINEIFQINGDHACDCRLCSKSHVTVDYVQNRLSTMFKIAVNLTFLEANTPN